MAVEAAAGRVLDGAPEGAVAVGEQHDPGRRRPLRPVGRHPGDGVQAGEHGLAGRGRLGQLQPVDGRDDGVVFLGRRDHHVGRLGERHQPDVELLRQLARRSPWPPPGPRRSGTARRPRTSSTATRPAPASRWPAPAAPACRSTGGPGRAPAPAGSAATRPPAACRRTSPMPPGATDRSRSTLEKRTAKARRCSWRHTYSAGQREHRQHREQPPRLEEPDHRVVPLVRACRAAATNLTISSSQSESVRSRRWAAPAPRMADATAARWAAAAAA